MPSLRDSGKLIEFPASIKKLAHHCNLPFPVSLRRLIANPDCPPRPSVTIHADPERIRIFESSTLSWTSTDAISASLDVQYADFHHEVSAVLTSGSMEFTGKETGVIICTITVTGTGGTSTAKQRIVVV
jgi:hypothetical protein